MTESESGGRRLYHPLDIYLFIVELGKQAAFKAIN